VSRLHLSSVAKDRQHRKCYLCVHPARDLNHLSVLSASVNLDPRAPGDQLGGDDASVPVHAIRSFDYTGAKGMEGAPCPELTTCEPMPTGPASSRGSSFLRGLSPDLRLHWLAARAVGYNRPTFITWLRRLCDSNDLRDNVSARKHGRCPDLLRLMTRSNLLG
jgi:hypothetical protein